MGFSTYRTGFRALEGPLDFDATRPAASSGAAYLGERVQISLGILAARQD